MDCDVAIVGAGTGGLALGKFLADLGYHVIILEQAEEKHFGNTWCNDLETSAFLKYDLPIPNEQSLAFDPKDPITLKTTDNQFQIAVPNQNLYTVKMDDYQKQLAADCVEAGIEIFYHTQAMDFLYQKGAVSGLLAEDKKNNRELRITAKCVVCACGDRSSLLQNILEEYDINIQCDPRDYVSAIQNLYKIDQDKAEESVSEKRILDSQVVVYTGISGGYSTLLYHLDIQRGVIGILAGSRAQDEGVLPPEQIIENFKNDLGFCGEKVLGGGRPIAIRSALDNMVGEGIALLGDAAFMACPMNGSGVLNSMIAARFLSETLHSIFQQGERASKEKLWEYNYRYHTSVNYALAGFYLTQKMARQLTETEVQDGYKYRILTAKDFHQVHLQVPLNIGFLDGLQRFIHSLGRLPLLFKILKSAPKVLQITRHYQKYPQFYVPSLYKKWKMKTVQLLSS